MRLRLACGEARRALLAELLESRGLGPDPAAPVALVEAGLEYPEAAALVFDPARLEALPSLLDSLCARELRAAREAREAAPEPRSIAFRSGEGIELVPLRSVLYFEAEGQVVRGYTAASAGEVRERLYELEEKLPSARFARVSKSAVANLGAVREVHPWFGRGLVLRFGVEGRQVEVSRNYVAPLKDRLGI